MGGLRLLAALSCPRHPQGAQKGASKLAGCMGIGAPHPMAAPALWCGTAQAAGTASARQVGLWTDARVLECQHDSRPRGGSHQPFAQQEGPASPSLQHPGEHRKQANNLKLMVFWAKICSVIYQFFLSRNVSAFQAPAVTSMLSKNSFHTSSNHS